MNTIIEKIRAEVERLKVDYLNRSYTFVPKAKQDLLDFLSDLEKECEDFPTTDKEMAKFLATHPKVELPEKYKTSDWMFEKSEKPIELDFEQELYKHFGQVKDFTLGMQIGKYFYELGKQSKPEVCEGLEEEISRHLRDDFSYDDEPSISEVARHFAQWQKEQMMKEAVEGEVKHFATVHYVLTNEDQLTARLKQFQDGDKVKIIIVKEG